MDERSSGLARSALGGIPTPVGSHDQIPLFEKIRKAYRELVYFPDKWTYSMASLFVLQTWISELLDNCFYIAFAGGKGTGKTTALEVTAALSHQALLTNNVSAAAIARIVSQPLVASGEKDKPDSERAFSANTMFVDELDELGGEAQDVVQGILRAGYRRGVYYIRCEGKSNTPVAYDVFGPKAFTFRGEAEDALMSRTYIGRTELPPEGERVEMTLRNFSRNLESLENEIREWRFTLPERTKGMVKDRPKEASFKEKLAQIINETNSSRAIELMTTCLLISEICGIDLIQEFRDAIEDQGYYESEEKTSFVEDILTAWDSFRKPKIVKYQELRSSVNYFRRERKETPYTNEQFTKLMRESGFSWGSKSKGNTVWKANGGVRMVYFAPNLVTRLQNSVTAPSESVILGENPVTSVGNALPGSEHTLPSSSLFVTEQQQHVTGLSRSHDRVWTAIEEHLRGIAEVEGTWTVDDLTNYVALSPDIEGRVATQWLEKSLNKGVFYETKNPGVYRFI